MWTIFVFSEFGHGDCCGVGYDFIFINEDYTNSVTLINKIFPKRCKNGTTFSSSYPHIASKESLIDGWKLVKNYYINSGFNWEKSIFNVENPENIFDNKMCKVIKNFSRIIMPNGIDGMNCEKCNDFYQYVEANTSTLSYICKTCRE